MTKDFITKSVKFMTDNNSIMNTWTTLNGKISRINLLSDTYISIDPRYRMFYFDTTREILYVRNTIGFSSTPLSSSSLSVSINGKTYYTEIAESSVTSSAVGKYHQAISFDKIVSFSYVDRELEAQKYLEELK